jgi:hypothetical protein
MSRLIALRILPTAHHLSLAFANRGFGVKYFCQDGSGMPNLKDLRNTAKHQAWPRTGRVDTSLLVNEELLVNVSGFSRERVS